MVTYYTVAVLLCILIAFRHSNTIHPAHLFFAGAVSYCLIVPIFKPQASSYPIVDVTFVIAASVMWLIGLNFYAEKFHDAICIDRPSADRLDVYVGILLCLTGFLSLLFVTQSLGGVDQIRAISASLATEIGAKSFFTKLAWEFSALYFFGLAILIRAKVSTKYILLLFCLGVYLYLVFTRRGVILNGFFLLAMAYSITYKPVVNVARLLASISVIGIIMGYLLWSRLSSYDADAALTFDYFINSPEFYVTDILYYVLADYPNALPLRLGVDFLPGWMRDPFLSVSDRNDFVSLGAELSAWYLPRFYAGTPPTIIGAVYMNFGWLSLILSSFASVLVSACYLAILRSRWRYDYLLAGSFLAFCFTFFRNGDMWVAFAQTLRAAIVLLLAILLLRWLLGGVK